MTNLTRKSVLRGLMSGNRLRRWVLRSVLAAALLLAPWFASRVQFPAPDSSDELVRVDNSPRRAANARLALAAPEAPEAAQANKEASQTQQFAAWAETFDSKSATAEELNKGLKLAEARRDALQELIVSNPEQALQKALPLALRQKLPDSFSPYLEKRVSGRGKYSVVATTPPDRHETTITRTVTLQGQTYQAHVYGRRTWQISKENIPLHGIVLGHSMAVHESPLRILEPGEKPDPSKPIANPDGACPIKGVVSRHVAADAGDVIYFLCCDDCPAELTNQLIAFENGSGTTTFSGGQLAASSWTQGNKKVLYINLKFSDTPTEFFSQAAMQNMANGCASFYLEASYGTASMTSTLTPLLTLPQTKAFYAANGDYKLQSDGWAVSAAAGYNKDNYDLDAVCWMGGGGGMAYVGSRGAWLKDAGAGVAAHEFGHNFGLMHANYWAATDKSLETGNSVEYGDDYDTMGNGGIAHFNACFKNILGWIPSANVTTVSSSGTYRITAFDQPVLDAAARYALKIPKVSDPSSRVYWVDFRQLYTTNPWLMNGAELHWAPWYYSNGGTHLLDTTFDSPNGKNDGAVVIGRTYTDTAAGLYITPIRKGGTTPESLDVVVNIGSFPGNNPPTVTVNASSTSVGVGVPISLTATASDSNGDTLAYYWDVGDGTLMGNSSALTKSWGTAGTYTVSCTASDMKGGSTSASVVIYVSNAAPPVAQNHTVLVSPNTAKAITLVATDPNGDPLTYTVVTGPLHGVLSGSTPNLTYTPAIGYLGSDSFTFKANDGTADSNLATVGIFVANNDPTLVGWWKLDDGSGLTAADSSGNGNTGTLTNGPVWVAGKISGALSLDGGNDYVALPNTSSLNITSAITMAAWVKTIASTYAPIIGGYQNDAGLAGYGLCMNYPNIGKVGYWSGANGAWVTSTSSTYNSNTWHHVAVTISGTTATFYKDGVADGTGVTQQPNSYAGVRAIGAAADLGNGLFTGTLDDVRIYNRALSDNDIADLLVGSVQPGISVSVTATDPNASETAPDTGTFTLTRTGSTAAALTVNYSLSGSATNGTDYASLSGSVTIPAGSATVLITLTPTDDILVEGSETATLTLSANAAYTVGSPNSATETITDNDNALPTVTVAATDSTANEFANGGIYTITRTGSTASALTVIYLMSGSATNGVDYVSLSGSVTVAAGSASADVIFTPIDDAAYEGTEMATLTLSANASYLVGTPNSATVQLNDNDSPPLPTVTVSATDANASETSSDPGTYTISRTGSTAAALTVNYTLSGTAVNGIDYASLSGSLTIPAGSATSNLTLSPVDDTLVEGSETVIQTISANAAYTVGSPGSATVTIFDNDSSGGLVGYWKLDETSGLTAADASVNGNTGTLLNGTDWVPGKVGGALSLGIHANYVSLPNSSSLNITSAITMAAWINTSGSNSEYIIGGILDTAPNAGYALIVNYPNVGDVAYWSGAQGTWVRSVSANYNDGTWHHVAVTVSGTTATFYKDGVADGTAATQQPNAYAGVRAIGGSALGTNCIFNGLLDEVQIHSRALSASEIAALAGGVTLPTVTVAASDANASESAPDTGAYTISRTGSTAAALTVNYALSGSAVNGTDYAGLSGSLTIPAGSATAALTLTPIDDTQVESSETAVLSISANAAYAVGSPGSASITIADNDINGGLAGYWKLDETSGLTAADASVNGNTGTLLNGTDWVPGKVGGALSLGIHANYVSLPNSSSLNITSAITMAAWINTSGSNSEYIIGGILDTAPNAGYALIVNYPNVGDVAYWSGAQGTWVRSVSANYNDGTWHHVAVTVSGTTATFYKDGVADGTAATQQPNAYAGVRAIGGSALGTNCIFNGLLDEVQIHSRALSASEIAALAGGVTLPTVTVAASDANASESAPDTGAYTISRTGSTAAALTVNYALSGSAVNGTDYAGLSGSLTIPVGLASATITLTPIDDTLVESSEMAVLSISANAAYSVGSPGSASITIADNDSNGGLAGYWKLDETSGLTAADASVNGNTGTLLNGTDWVPGKVGGALSLGIHANYVSLPNTSSLNITSAITMAAWINTSGSNSEYIIGGILDTAPNAGYALIVNYPNVGDVAYWSGAQGTWVRSVSANYNDGTWHHVAVTVSGTTATFYKDGIADGTAATQQPNAYAGVRAIGGSALGTNCIFNGLLDEVRIYNRALSASEVATLFGSAGLPSNNSAPSITSAAFATPNPAGIGQAVSFTAAGNDADGDPLTYTWAFGDGATGSGSTVMHSYIVAGTYNASVVVSDGRGGSAGGSVTVVVTSSLTLQNGINGYAGAQDTFLYNGSPNRNYGSVTALQSSNSSSNVITRTMLVRFAIFKSEGGPVPDGATIQSATLSLYKYSSYDHSYEARRLLKGWNELETTWNSSKIGALWSAPGALGLGTDLAASADGQASVGSAAGWLNLDVTAGVQAFASGTTNHGWHVLEVGGKGTVKKFYSREYTGSVSLRPKLTVLYTTSNPSLTDAGK